MIPPSPSRSEPRVPAPRLAPLLSLLAFAPTASAHDGSHATGLLAGLAHPLGGIDHLLVTFGLGLIAGLAMLRDARPARVAIGSFTGLVAGLVAGALGAALAATSAGPMAVFGTIETAAAFGLLAVAVALVGADRLGSTGFAALAVVVALPHGWVHASEGSGVGYLAGLALTSVALFAVGVVATRHGAARVARPWRWRAAGAAAYAAAFAWITAVALS